VLAAGGVGLSLTFLIVFAVGLLVRRERTALALAVRGLQERDIAAREAAQARRRSRFLEESATDVLFLTDPGLRLTYVSPAAWAQLGLAPPTLVGRAAVDIVHADEVGLVAAAIAQLQESDAVVAVTHRMRHGDGRWLWVETLLRAIRDPETGALLEVQGSTRDVSARRETERRLREAENRFRSAFDEAPLGMVVVGLDGEVLQINRALCELAGEDASDLRGTAFDALLHQADADTHRQAREALLDGELSAHNAELRVVRPSGHVVWTAMSTALVLDADGQPRYYLTQVQDVSERRRAEGQLQFLADHDPLTGLLNRRAFERSLKEHLTRVRRYGVQGAVLVVDLDSFAAVNERLGPSRGDELILAVARAVRRRLRASDLVARFGGDGFAVLLPHADLQEALVVGGALVDAVRSVEIGEGEEPLTASVGVALVDRPELRGDDLLIDADLAMYDAKQGGRNRVRQARRPLTGRRRFRPTADLADQIREALREDRLVLYAEPVVDLQSGRTVQLELLLRLRGRDGDLQAPASFLPATDHHELVRELDRWTIARAVSLLAEHPRGPSIAVKVSVRSLAGEELVDTLGAELTARNVDPRRLTIELDESEAASHLPRVQELARDLHHLGCPLALDDFGGGFGSFYSLKHLPFDVLKIDGGFVRHCAHEHADQLVIGAMVDMAAGNAARTVAKFVEDDVTAAALRRLGVDAGQGAGFGRPVPAAEAFANAVRP
jgi:diguanylate cyclase (GGDEF)-like protein/PAS domain S-box-containing protein